MMLKIGLTGGIGCGKSTVAELFSSLGAPVIDADVIARDLVRPGSPSLIEISLTFGADILLSNGELDRRKLGDRVFADPSEKAKLEQILHPRVRISIREQLSEYEEEPYVIIVIPLLLETGLQDLVDRVLVVDADEALRIARVRVRDGRTVEQIRAVMNNQVDDASRRKAADDIIENNTTVDALAEAVDRLHRQYLAMASDTTS